MRKQDSGKSVPGKGTISTARSSEAGTRVACWRDGMSKEEHVGDEVREKEP